VGCLELITLPPSMLNELPSHAGEKGVFDIKASLLTFLPLSAISHDAQALQEKYLAPIQARIDDGDCPPGLRKQYKLQLEHIKAQAPSHEIVLVPSIAFSLGERDSLGTPPSPADPHQQYLILRGNMQPSCPFRTGLSPAVPLCASGIYRFSLRANANAQPWFTAHQV
jgi:hypothetical protein